MHVSIGAGDILGVLPGPSKNGETSVQVFVREDAKLEFVVAGTPSELSLSSSNLQAPTSKDWFSFAPIDRLLGQTLRC
jgi:hypothetical protein